MNETVENMRNIFSTAVCVLTGSEKKSFIILKAKKLLLEKEKIKKKIEWQ